MQGRSATIVSEPHPGQLSIFDLEAAEEGRAANAALHEENQPEQSASKQAKASTHARHPIPPPPLQVIAIEDLPQYPPELIEQIDRCIADLPPEKLWFTYRDIQRCFGVSRATIARRMHDGLIPGIRMLGSRVLDDGAVRRFDRTQLRWLLLSVRCSCEAASASVLAQGR